MKTFLFPLALISAALPLAAVAQDSDAALFVTAPAEGDWRANDLLGRDVFGAEGERVGAVEDVLFSYDGRMLAVLVDVGGFLGIGAKTVAVGTEALQLGPGATEAEADAAAAQNPAAPTDAPMSTGVTGNASDDDSTTAIVANRDDAEGGNVIAVPDRVLLDLTREQLESAPAFQDTVTGR